MISLAPGTKVFLACRPVDLRNGFDGLAADLALALGTAVVACGLLIGLKAVMPNYFFQDDNVMQFQPMLTRVGRELFGVFRAAAAPAELGASVFGPMVGEVDASHALQKQGV